MTPILQTKMPEEKLHTTWDVCEALLGEDTKRGFPSEFLVRAYRRGLLTFDEAMEMYMCAIGLATTDSLEPVAA